MTDYLATTLAAEEHRQGMSYGDDAGHCGRCAAEALRRRQAACEHENANTVEMTTLDQPRQDLLKTCRDCGLSWREDGEWL